jgi:mannose-6-phosphate isomerase-like protein (cupin superfamily)
MLKPGDVLENPVTGERFVFRKTARETAGELLVFDFYLAPGGRVPGLHVHPKQEERWRILAGRAGARIGRRRHRAEAGAQLVVPAGTTHMLWNEASEELHLLNEFRPALDIEGFFEAFLGLAAKGKVTRKGIPHARQMAALLHSYRNEVALPFVPLGLQRVALAAVASLSRPQVAPKRDTNAQ